MTDPETPEWRTGVLWVLLGVLLVFGAVGTATVVYGLTGGLAGHAWALLAIPIGGAVAFLAFLFMAGILYRVDRYRGVNARRVEFFE